MCAGGALVCFQALVWCFCSFVVSLFCLGSVESLASPKGIETFPLSSDLVL
jgi:hypothetical protein